MVTGSRPVQLAIVRVGSAEVVDAGGDVVVGAPAGTDVEVEDPVASVVVELTGVDGCPRACGDPPHPAARAARTASTAAITTDAPDRTMSGVSH